MQINQVFENASYGSVNTAPTYMQFYKVRSELGKVDATVLKHIITTDKVTMQEYDRDIAQFRQDFDNTLSNYAKNACNGNNCMSDENEQKMYDEVLQAKLEYYEAVDQGLRFSRENKTLDAEQVVKTKIGPTKDVLNDKIMAELQYNEKLANEAIVRAQNAKSSANQLSIMISLLALAGLGVFAYLITRNLLSQLGREPAELAQLAEEFAQGNLSANIVLADNDRTSTVYSIKQLQTTLKTLTADTNELVVAAAEGKLATRADANKFNGDFKILVNGFNQTLDGVINPLNVAAEYVENIAKGNIPARITDEYKGDFNRLKTTSINVLMRWMPW